MDVAKILVLLTSVIYAMGWLRALLPLERVRAAMRGRSGPSARLMAVGLGAMTPFCSCSSIPLFIGFVEAGIPLGVTLSFLIASPMVNQVAVVVLAGVIGWQMTLIYVLTGLAIAFIDVVSCRPSGWSAGSKPTSGRSAWTRRSDLTMATAASAPAMTMPGMKCARSSDASGSMS